MATVANQNELRPLKSRQRGARVSGDYAVLAERSQPVADDLCTLARLRAGERVLDVVTGSGNAAIAAARRGCRVVGLDYVHEVLDETRARATAEGLAVEVVDGDAEELPFPDASFDAVISCVGVMFVPDQESTARELARVCRGRGTIALASWTPEGFVGRMLELVERYVRPPTGVKPATRWGSGRGLLELLAGLVDQLRTERREHLFRFPSVADCVGFLTGSDGPLLKVVDALEPEEAADLKDELAGLVHGFDRLVWEPSVAVPAEYLVAIARRDDR